MRICIVDDDAHSVDTLKDFIARFEKEEGVTCIVTVFGDGIDFVSDYAPIYDLVFMDIEMPHMNGMDAAARLRETDAEVMLVFTTRLARFALKGYEVDASGYLVKPFEYFSFARYMKKASGHKRAEEGSEMFVKTAEGLVKVNKRDIRFVEIFDHFLVYHTTSRDIRAYGQISKAEAQLPPPDFFRCNKSCIVNFRHVSDIGRDRVVVDGYDIAVSRSHKKDLIRAFNAYIGGKTYV